ncbi:unnamed protein product, partial [Ectocarpus sp. 8 AP-2014]
SAFPPSSSASPPRHSVDGNHVLQLSSLSLPNIYGVGESAPPHDDTTYPLHAHHNFGELIRSQKETACLTEIPLFSKGCGTTCLDPQKRRFVRDKTTRSKGAS